MYSSKVIRCLRYDSLLRGVVLRGQIRLDLTVLVIHQWRAQGKGTGEGLIPTAHRHSGKWFIRGMFATSHRKK